MRSAATHDAASSALTTSMRNRFSGIVLHEAQPALFP